MSVHTPFRILSLDGGAIRGLVTAIILERLEQKLQLLAPNTLLKDYFDLIAGTSTGSLIACGISHGMSTSEIKNLYLTEAKNIFPPHKIMLRSIINRIRIGSSLPIYDGIGLSQVLKQVFGELTFKQLSKPTLITSYDTYNAQAVVFKNTKEAHRDLPVWEICRSSSAAPVAFPGHLLKHPAFLQDWQNQGHQIPADGGIPLIDGGVFANDPALCAIAERLKWNQGLPDSRKVERHDIVVASFGTGQQVKQIGFKEVQQWGTLEWLSPNRGLPFLDVLSDGAGDAVAYIAEQIIGDRYYRFQTQFTEEISAIDSSRENISALQNNAQNYLNQPFVERQLDQLVEILHPVKVPCLT